MADNTQQASLVPPTLTQPQGNLGLGTPAPSGQGPQIINAPGDKNSAPRTFVDITGEETGTPGKEIPYSAPTGPARGPIQEIEVPPYDPNAAPYNPKQIQMVPPEENNPRQIQMAPQTSAGPVIINDEIAAARAARFDFSLADKSPGIPALFNNIMNGKEPDIRHSAVLDALQKSNEDKVDLLTKYAQEGSAPGGMDNDEFVKLLVGPITRVNPRTILERNFADRVSYQAIALDDNKSYNVAMAQGEGKEYHAQLNLSQDVIAKQQILRNKIDYLEDNLRKQSWLGWGWDQAEYFGGLGFTEAFALGWGGRRQAEVSRMWSLSPEDFERNLEDKIGKFWHNPHLQLDYAKMLLGVSNSDAFALQVTGLANAALLFGYPAFSMGKTGLRRALSRAPGEALEKEIEAARAKGPTPSTPTPETPPSPIISSSDVAFETKTKELREVGLYRDSLWNKVQKGNTTELGQQSSILTQAKQLRDAGQLGTREQFEKFVDWYDKNGKAQEAPWSSGVGPDEALVRTGNNPKGYQLGDKVWQVGEKGEQVDKTPKTIKDITFDKKYGYGVTFEEGGAAPLNRVVHTEDYNPSGKFNPEFGEFENTNVGPNGIEQTSGTANIASQMQSMKQATSQKAVDPKQILDIGSSDKAAEVMATAEASAIKQLEEGAASVGQKESFQEFIAKMLPFANPSNVMNGARSFNSNTAREYFIKTIFDDTNNLLHEAFINPLTIDRFTETELSNMFHIARKELGNRLPSMSQRINKVEHIPAESVPGKTDTYKFYLGPEAGQYFSTAEQAHSFARYIRLGSYEVVPDNNAYSLVARLTIDATKDEVRNLLGAEVGPSGVLRKPGDDIVNGLQRTLRYFPKISYNIPSRKNLVAEGISKYMDVAAVTQNGIERAARQLWEAIDSVPGTPKLPFAKFRTPRPGTDRNNFVKFLANERDTIVDGKVGKFSNTLDEFDANWLETYRTLPSDEQRTAYFAYRRLNDLDALGLNMGIYRDKLRQGAFHIQLPFTNKISIAEEAMNAVATGTKATPELAHLFTEPLEVKALGNSAVRHLPQGQGQSARVMIWDKDTGQISTKDIYGFTRDKRKALDSEGIHQIYQVHPQQSLEALRASKGLVLENNGYTIAPGATPEAPLYNKPNMETTLSNMRTITEGSLTRKSMQETIKTLESDTNLTQPQRNYYGALRRYMGGMEKGKEDEMNYLMKAYLKLTNNRTNKEVSLGNFYEEYKAQIAASPPKKRTSVMGETSPEDKFYIKSPKEFFEHITKKYGRFEGETPDIKQAKPWLVSGHDENPFVTFRPHTPEVEPTVAGVNRFAGQENPMFHYLIVKGGDVPKVSDLPFWQLPYRPGGHLQVQNPWMISEPDIHFQPTSPRAGEWLHYGDKNLFSAKFESDAKAIAEQLYEAKRIYGAWKEKGITQETAMEQVQKLMPLGVEGKLQGKLPGQFVFDAKGARKPVPITWEDFKGYFEGPNKFLNPDPNIPILHRPLNQSSLNFHNLASRTDNTGRVMWPGLRGMNENIHTLYGSELNLKYATERGDHIASVKGTGGTIGSKYRPAYNIVPTDYLDPLATIKNSFSATARNGYLSDLKFKTAENFVQAFKDVIDKPLDVLRSDPFRALGDADWAPLKKNTAPDQLALWRSAYAYRKAATEFLNIPDKTEKYVQLLKAQLKEMVYRNLGEKRADLVDKIFPWSSTNDPINAIKAYTFDNSKIFDPRQIVIQGTTALHNVAVLGPVKGMQALSGGMWMSMIGRGASDETIAAFAKRAANMGYPNFEEAYRALERTNFRIVGRETVDLNNYLNASAMRDTYLERIRDYGRVFFKIGEGYSRMSAWSGAFQEWRAANPTKRIMDRDIADILARANTLSMDMTSSAAASWQKGIWSIPTQFASWNARLAEQMLPGYSTRLSGKEKLQAFLTYGAIYGFPIALTGAVGVWPIHKSIAKYAMDQWGDGKGNPIDNENLVAQTLNRGLLQTISAHTIGDYNFADKLGTGGISWIPELIRGDKTAWASMTGPTGQMLSNYYDAVSPFARWAVGPFDNTNERFPLTYVDFENVFKNLASVNNLGKAWVAYNTGTYISNHGMDVARGMTPSDAIVLGLTGALPQRVEDAFLMSESNRDLNSLQKYFKPIIIEKMRLAWKAASEGDFANANDFQKQVKAYLNSGGYQYSQYSRILGEAAKGYESMEERVHMEFMKLHPKAMERIMNGK